MPITAINTAATAVYVCKNDDRDEQGNPKVTATRWKLSAKDGYIDAYVQSNNTTYRLKDGVNAEDLETSEDAQSNMDFNIDVQSMAIDTVRLCLKGFDNFKNADGSDVQFKTKKTSIKGRMYEAVDPNIMAKIPRAVIMELYEEIDRISSLSEEEVKNSATG